MSDKKYLLLLFDLYWLRYEKPGEQWYELTDYLREKLKEDGYNVQYDDKNKQLIAGNVIFNREILKTYEKKR